MPPVMSNHPDRYVDQIFEKVLTTFSREDTLTTSLQDWRKGRRAEVDDVNGVVVETLIAHGRDAPINRRVVEIALDIEAGRIDAKPQNAELMITAYQRSDWNI
jgi:2-dehydropantoate 2-reductase